MRVFHLSHIFEWLAVQKLCRSLAFDYSCMPLGQLGKLVALPAVLGPLACKKIPGLWHWHGASNALGNPTNH